MNRMNKKGTTMVEAALVMPVVVLVTMTLLVVGIFLFLEVRQASVLYQVLLSESTLLSETATIDTADDSALVSIDKETLRLFPRLAGKIKVSHVSKGIFSYRLNKGYEAYRYIINETEYIRWIDSLEKME